MVICPDCGKEVPKENFCKNCGAHLAGIEEPAEKVEVPIDEVLDVSADETVESETAEEVSVPADEAEKSHEEIHEEKTKSQVKTKYCSNCGHKLPADFRFCPNCGQDQESQIVSTEKAKSDKSTLLAVILSVILPGLGQIYLGLDRKGAIFLIAYVISAFLIIFVIGLLLVLVIWIWALVDTITSSSALERGEEVSDRLF